MSFGASNFERLEWATRAGRTAVRSQVDLHGAGRPVPGVTRNISLDGAFVATSQLLPVGAPAPDDAHLSRRAEAAGGQGGGALVAPRSVGRG